MKSSSTTVCFVLLVSVFTSSFGAPIPVQNSVGTVNYSGRTYGLASSRVDCQVQDTVPDAVCDLFKARVDLRLTSFCRRSVLTTAPEDYKCDVALEKGGVFVTHNTSGNVWYLTLDGDIYSVVFETIFDGLTSGFPNFNYVATLGKLDCID